MANRNYTGQVVRTAAAGADPDRWITVVAASMQDAAFKVIEAQGWPEDAESCEVLVAPPNAARYPNGSPMTVMGYRLERVKEEV